MSDKPFDPANVDEWMRERAVQVERGTLPSSPPPPAAPVQGGGIVSAMLRLLAVLAGIGAVLVFVVFAGQALPFAIANGVTLLAVAAALAWMAAVLDTLKGILGRLER